MITWLFQGQEKWVVSKATDAELHPFPMTTQTRNVRSDHLRFITGQQVLLFHASHFLCGGLNRAIDTRFSDAYPKADQNKFHGSIAQS